MLQYAINKPSFRTFLSVCLTLLLLLQPLVPTVATTVLSEPRFSDCPVTHPYYASIAALADMGVVSGTGGISVAPDRAITKAEYIALLVRLFHPDAVLSDFQPWYIPYQKYLVQQGIFRTSELSYINSAITWEYLYPSALYACGIYPYPAALYDNMPAVSNYDLVTSAVYTLLDADVMDAWFPLKAAPTRGEAMDFLYRLYCTEYEGPEALTDLGLTEKNFFISDLASRWHIRNGFLHGLSLLPQKYIDYYHSKGWDFVIDDIGTYFPEMEGVAGLFASSTQKIYINASAISTTLHELGHFLWWYLHLTDYADMMFQDTVETQGLITLAKSTYCLTDSAEWFAEAFAVVLELHQTEEGRTQLAQYMPKTYAAIRDGLLNAEGLVDKAVFDQYFPVS